MSAVSAVGRIILALLRSEFTKQLAAHAVHLAGQELLRRLNSNSPRKKNPDTKRVS